MANKLLTKEEASEQLFKGFTEILDKEGVPEEDRAKIIIAVLAPLMELALSEAADKEVINDP